MRSTVSGYSALSKAHKFSAAGLVTAAGAAALTFALVPQAQAADAHSVGVKPVSLSAQEFGVTQDAELAKAADAAAGQAQVKAAAAVKAEAKAKADAAAKAKADRERASRSEARKPMKPAAKPAAKPAPAKPAAKPAPVKKAYADNLDGWINESLDILRAKGIPASYDGIKRNIMRESTGNPQAINDWDVNAVNGVPSKGLLQIIDPTFKAYHVEGTSWDIYNPVANITASCNYAADKYGSMDNVNSAY
ncbi:transglycosylase SLT domain-containing protein [Streptomyces griseocarneus]|uniref:Transglycosylase SLT domain-containing protein n=2 Tax=Streptomyces TaxID=1883 RepID=A0ABX7RMB3_9ACTN|nr:transglycosylase SLT domain-containing protein [Streptomyces griseocarneus]QSY48803.1 transglycosylase SLT domain-containing protein [Streptomyces griseocarneus]QSY49400.1 transglycosylase SLT domain-containing protein [Streptomyces griseocarneus]